MATSPAPDAAAPPGMCPGIAVLGGGGAGGDGDGSGNGGKDGAGGNGSGDGEGGAGDGKGAASGDGCGGGSSGSCPTHHPSQAAGHPVDVVTGRAFTNRAVDVELPGPLLFEFARWYSSALADRDAGLGFGWSHSFAWEIQTSRGRLTLFTDDARAFEYPRVDPGGRTQGRNGWVLSRSSHRYLLEAEEGVVREFCDVDGTGRVHRLTKVFDPFGNAIELSYDHGRLSSIIDSVGREIRVRSDAGGHIAGVDVKITTSQVRWVPFVEYLYDGLGDLVSVVDAEHNAWTFAYASDHLLAVERDPNGLAFHFVYDDKRRCVETWGAYQGRPEIAVSPDAPKTLSDGTPVKGIHHVKLTYGTGGYTEVVDSRRLRRFFGNAGGKVDKAVDGGRVTTWEYDSSGHPSAAIDPLGRATSWKRDSRGRLLQQTDALGGITEFERDSEGRVLKFRDPAGRVTIHLRGPRGEVLQTTEANGAVTSYRYDSKGQLIEQWAPNGGVTRFAYDAHGNLVELTLPNGAVYRFECDWFGRRCSITDPTGGVRRFDYDMNGRVVRRTEVDGSRVHLSYDGCGNLVGAVDASGQVWRYEYGGASWLTATHSPDGATIRILHDLEGAIVRIVNELGEIQRYERDIHGAVVYETAFDGLARQFRRNAMGFVTAYRDTGGTEKDYEYDDLDRVVAITYADGSVATRRYDPTGVLLGGTLGSSVVNFELGPLGNVSTEEAVGAGGTSRIDLGYDAEGQLVERRSSLGLDERIDRDVMGARTRTLLDGSIEILHRLDVMGLERERILPRGGAVRSTYDLRRRLIEREAVSSGATGTISSGGPPTNPTFDGYRYDSLGNVSARITSRGNTSFAHDVVGQLAEVRRPGAPLERYRHDVAGNLFEATPGGLGRQLGAGNRLLTRGNVEYRHDAGGRLVEKVDRTGLVPATTRYGWSAQDWLGWVELPDGRRVEFDYDAFARRTEKRVLLRDVSGRATVVSRTRWIWDGDEVAHEIRELSALSGDAVVEERTYVFADEAFVPLAERRERGWLHYLNDPAGAPEHLVDDAGRLVWSADRAGWGKESSVGADASSLRFAGQIADDETGLHYNRHRYYDPETGTFLSRDPLELAGGINVFAYVPSPMSWIDPFGLAHTASATVNGAPLKPANGNPEFDSTQSGAEFDALRARKNPGKVEALDRQLCHTEQKACEAARNAGVGKGDKVKIKGSFTPCFHCRGAMNDLAADTGCDVEYEYQDENGNTKIWKTDQKKALAARKNREARKKK